MNLKSTVENLLAYACVIERYDRERSVIPMRFGCVFQTLGQLSEGIERRQEEITALLTKLDRRTEMSARILVDRPSIPASRVNGASDEFESDHASSLARHQQSSTPGRSYLARRGQYYELRRNAELEDERVYGSILEFLAGSFEECRREPAKVGTEKPFVLHFLVPRREVEQFVSRMRSFENRAHTM